MSQLESRRDDIKLGKFGGGRRRIRVAIVENHQLVSESLAMLLDSQQDMQVVGTAASVHDAALLPRHLSPDVVVLDFHLGDGNGRDAALVLREVFPSTRFVFLSRDGTDETRLAAVEAGASAYLLKSGPGSEVVDALRRVARGESLISPATIAQLVSRGRDRDLIRSSLSPRELEVLRLMADGLGAREIAKQLGIGYTTVRTHVRSISHKLGTHSTVKAVVTARELELVN
jgi:DNA-binding NarL/FixJ family response regulator